MTIVPTNDKKSKVVPAKTTTTARTLPPVIVLGGNDNALSIVRALGKRGITVFSLNHQSSDVGYSRYAKTIPFSPHNGFEKGLTDWLLGDASRDYAGSVLLAANDEALSVLATNREALKERYLLDLCNPAAQLSMLDKKETYFAATKAGVPTPRFWCVQNRDDILAIENELVYPIIAKPELSHLFQQKFDSKFLVANNFDQLLDAFTIVDDANIDVMLVEKISGPDSLLCSYYTWLDENSQPMLDFTKRIVRRYPMNMGLATYHVTAHVDGLKELCLKLFQHVGLQGLANAEFKFDERDGQFKLIECNARFTAANGLVNQSGIDLASFVYNRIVGLPAPPTDTFRDGLTLWDPMRDWKAYRELRASGQLSSGQWLRSILKRQNFTCLSLTDPMPAIHRTYRRFRKLSKQ